MSHLLNDISTTPENETHAEEIAEKYPWSSVAQLALLKHYKKTNSSHFEKQATKVALFFNDDNWLNWQLHLLSKENETEEIFSDVSSETMIEQEEPNGKIQQSLSQISSRANTREESIAFEPLHTVDYFASQGIEIPEEPASGDKLANQLKSFTDWLKSMKKLHKDKLTEGDDQTDTTIREIAEHSNAQTEVITEAMADVFIKQNKTDKAIEVYEKLSLINPSKSAYFAAKINSLKAL